MGRALRLKFHVKQYDMNTDLDLDPEENDIQLRPRAIYSTDQLNGLYDKGKK